MTDNGKMCVFISYAIEDRALAALIKDVLKANRVEVLDPMTDLLPGDSWQDGVAAMIRLANAYILVISQASRASERLRLEFLKGSARWSTKSRIGSSYNVPAAIRPAIIVREALTVAKR